MNPTQWRRQNGATDALGVEECCYRFWKIGGGMIAVGIVLMFTSVLFWLGAPLAAIGAAIIMGNILWFLNVNRQTGIKIACPNCEKEHTILPDFHRFVCDECQHEVPIPRAA